MLSSQYISLFFYKHLIMPWLRLIRWKNLLIIFLTQFLVWGCVILPENPKVLVPFNFLLITVSTMLIAAAGYIINDYFDIKIDFINHPEKVILEKVIPRKQAIISHTVLNVIALFLAAIVAMQAHHLEWLFFQATCTVLLWFYSTHFKRQYVTGNIVVALLTALTIIVLIQYEPNMHRNLQSFSFSGALSTPEWVLCIYAYFAFMLTWMREIVKDMEDHIGDEAAGCVTMPIKRGLGYATRFTIVLAILVISPLVLVSILLFRHQYILPPLYIIGALVLPLILWSVFLYRPAPDGKFTVQHYHKASRWLKVIMITGICSLLIYHFILLTHSAT